MRQLKLLTCGIIKIFLFLVCIIPVIVILIIQVIGGADDCETLADFYWDKIDDLQNILTKE